jgi:hypothetical protein
VRLRARHDRSLTLHAFDAFDYINGYTSSLGNQVDKYAHEIIEAGLVEMGFSSSQYVLDLSLQSKIGFLAPNGRKWGTIFKELCEAEQAIMHVDENGVIRFWNRQHFLSNASPVHTLTFSNMEDLRTQNTPVYNDVIVRAKPREVAGNQKVYELQTSKLLAAGTTTDVFVDFADDFGPLPVTAIDTPAAGGATSRYRANGNESGTGTDLDRKCLRQLDGAAWHLLSRDLLQLGERPCLPDAARALRDAGQDRGSDRGALLRPDQHRHLRA